VPRYLSFTTSVALFALAASPLGCSTDGKGKEPSGVPGAPDIGTFLPPGASPVAVSLQFPAVPDAARLTAIFMGFAEDQMEGDWALEGERPKLYWYTGKLQPAETLSFDVPLLPGLVYLVAVDLDGSVDVNSGDLVSAPQRYAEPLPPGMALEFFIDRPFSPGPEPGGMDLAARPTTRGGERRSVIVDSAFGLLWLRKSQLMVVGLPGREPEEYEVTGKKYPPRVAPTFLWVGRERPLKWPITLDALVPDGLDVFVVLDLDGNGYPSTGDISSLCACDIERPLAGSPPLGFTLESVVPSNEELADKFIFPDIDPPGFEVEDEEGDEPEGDEPSNAAPLRDSESPR